MTGSMYAAIAGLQTHMQKMNVIGNNIANANTAGFKPGVTTFTESMYTSLKTSTGGGTLLGGTNAAQIGYGSQISTIDVSMAAGTPAPTNINSNLYLSGSGFFLVGPKPTGEAGYQPDPNQLVLRRVGDFKVDENGYLVDANGNCVYGFMPQGDENGKILKDANGDIVYDTCLRPLRLPVSAPVPENPDDANAIQEGNAVYPTVTEDTNAFEYPDFIEVDDTTGVDDRENRVDVESINLSFGNNGVITAVTNNGEAITMGVIAIASVRNPSGLTKISEGYYQPGGNSGDVTVGTSGGVLKDAYLNNMNAEDDADDPTLSKITAAAKTDILSGCLESSNTDISTEFADLITTQRGFQANTKIITVTDEMLSELVSMKR